jgi:DNA replication protein DnaC
VIPPKILATVAGPGFDASKPAVVEALDFVSATHIRPYLFLLGKPGTGKSVAAAYAMMRARVSARANIDGAEIEVELPVTGAFVHAFDVIRAGTYDREFWAGLLSPHILVLDDLGAEPLDGKGWGKANLLNLLAQREANLTKTIVTSNATYQQLTETYLSGAGQRVLDRMREFPEKSVFELAGDSLRGVKLA